MKRLLHQTSVKAISSLSIILAMVCLVPHAIGSGVASDDLVIEALSGAGRLSTQERKLRLALSKQPLNVDAAVALAKLLVDRSRSEGDPRPAGQALAVLLPWPDAQSAPIEVLMQRANAQQHLHDFEAARSNLEQLVRRDARHAQAWLALATLHRLQGRYAASHQACDAVTRAGEMLYGLACSAENWGLQGHVKKARHALQQLLTGKAVHVEQRAWLLTTLAELEARARQNDAAEKAYQAAIMLSPRDPYLTVSYADFLLHQRRPQDAMNLLKSQPRSDAVLLRLTRARLEVKAPEADSDLAELTQRMNQDKLSPRERQGHAREYAMFAMWIQRDATRALEWARLNVDAQREPIDILLFAQAARLSQKARVLKEVGQLKTEMGLFDERTDELL